MVSSRSILTPLKRWASKISPCILFIDEIDALGRRRGRSSDSASAEQARL
ncbi:MAG: AAA family ATPase [Pyrinomonadaceae bacterium]